MGISEDCGALPSRLQTVKASHSCRFKTRLLPPNMQIPAGWSGVQARTRSERVWHLVSKVLQLGTWWVQGPHMHKCGVGGCVCSDTDASSSL